jgi:hypothetical protein
MSGVFKTEIRPLLRPLVFVWSTNTEIFVVLGNKDYWMLVQYIWGIVQGGNTFKDNFVFQTPTLKTTKDKLYHQPMQIKGSPCLDLEKNSERLHLF